jgi:hypothetical protein
VLEIRLFSQSFFETTIPLWRFIMRFPVIAALLLSIVIVLTSGKSKRVEKLDTSGANSDIIEAVVYGYGLEEELWNNESRMKKRDDVYALFRKGFGEKVSQELAEYYWMEGEDEDGERFAMLRSGDPVFILPDSIEVVDRGEERAVVILNYSKSEEGPITYRAYSIKIVLRKEGETWKIYEADSRWF